MTKETGSDLHLSVRGHGSFVGRPRPLKRLLALLTDFPLHLLAPFVGIFFFNQSPLPHPLVAGLWILWVALVHFVQRRFFGRTLGERVWGLQYFEGRGLLEQRPADGGVQAAAFVLTGSALLVATLMLQTILLFHPVLRQASPALVPQFAITNTEATGNQLQEWTRLPFYFATGDFPVSVDGSPVWYQLPYSRGLPNRFPLKVRIRLPREGSQLILEAPRTPEGLRKRRHEVRTCLTSARTWTRLSFDCLVLRRALLRRHALEMKPGGRSPVRWEMDWFEADRPELTADQSPMGVRLTARNGNELIHRFILLTGDGQHQAMTLETRADALRPDGDLPLLERLIGSLSLQTDLTASRQLINDRLASLQPQVLRSAGELDQLGHASALLISKATVEPSDPDTYYELAGMAMTLLRRSASTPAAELVSAIARPQAIAARKMLQDVAPSDPRNARLEQLLLDLQEF